MAAESRVLNTNPDALLQSLQAEGLELLGIVGWPDSVSGAQEQLAEQEYRQWLAEGRHGGMGYLERHAEGKYRPQFSLETARSLVIVGIPYFQDRPAPAVGTGDIARYAWGRDYHKVLLGKLKRCIARWQETWPDQSWRPFTDTAPLDERYWAAKAGATFTARNTLSIRRGWGSWFVLGEVLTSLELPTTPAVSHSHGSCPSACRRCVNVCPTGALDESGTIDARKCLSYWTIEHKGRIPDEIKRSQGNWLFGCDLCQEVCPFNLGAQATREPEFLAWKAGPELDLASILRLDASEFTRRFGGSPVHRTGRNGLVRNACIVSARSKNWDQLRPLVELLTRDADDGVRDAARWAIATAGSP